MLTRTEIRTWLSYWRAASMVNVDEITSLERVGQARKFCQCMNVGVFIDVTDGQIWDAIRDPSQSPKSHWAQQALDPIVGEAA